jgi:hypothetical protein
LTAGVLLTGAGANDLDPAVADLPKSRWVERSDVPVNDHFMRWSVLPREVSLDPLTAAEIKRLKLDAYRSPATCMQWFFLKRGKQLYPVGAALGRGQGVVKLNGALHEAMLGAGGVQIFRFDALTSMADARKHGYEETPAQTVGLLFQGAGFPRTTRYSGLCTMISARCRRYEVSQLSAHWRALREGLAYHLIELPLVIDLDSTVSWVSEDMCPMTNAAFLEGPWKSRMYGEAPGVLMNGFVMNRSLKKALKDVAAEAKLAKDELK